MEKRSVRAGVLEVAWVEWGDPAGWPCILGHGFPYDVHSYRHRFGLVPGDPAYAALEDRLAAQPRIEVPAVAIDGDADGVNFGTAHHADRFTGPFEYRRFRGAGHDLPQERPKEWAEAVLAARTLAED